MAQWVKDLVLSLLWRVFDSGSRNFQMLWAWAKNQNKTKNSLKNKRFFWRQHPTDKLLERPHGHCTLLPTWHRTVTAKAKPEGAAFTPATGRATGHKAGLWAALRNRVRSGCQGGCAESEGSRPLQDRGQGSGWGLALKSTGVSSAGSLQGRDLLGSPTSEHLG